MTNKRTPHLPQNARLETIYTVVYASAGCLPDSDPAEFSTLADAKRYMADFAADFERKVVYTPLSKITREACLRYDVDYAGDDLESGHGLYRLSIGARMITVYTPIETRAMADMNDPDLELIRDYEFFMSESGMRSDDDDHAGGFVKIANGDYAELWVFAGSIPHMHKTCYRLI